MISRLIAASFALLSLKGCASGDDYWTYLETINKDKYHGAGSVLVSNGEAMIYDVGRGIYASKIANEVKNLPLKVKYIVISHAHRDHMGALHNVYAELPEPKPIVYFNYPQRHVCDSEPDSWGCSYDAIDAAFRGVPYQSLLEGDRLTLGNFDMKVLAARYDGSLDENDESIIMMATHKPSGHTILYTGDANVRVGKYVVDKYNIKTDVLMLPHHGCKGQPHDNFYHEADPHIAVWQTNADIMTNRKDICGHTSDLLNKMGTPIQLHHWKLPTERINFPIEGVDRRVKFMAPIIKLLLSNDAA